MVRSILTGVRPVVIGGCELCLHHPHPELEWYVHFSQCVFHKSFRAFVYVL